MGGGKSEMSRLKKKKKLRILFCTAEVSERKEDYLKHFYTFLPNDKRKCSSYSARIFSSTSRLKKRRVGVHLTLQRGKKRRIACPAN